jgi:hypothetical protein
MNSLETRIRRHPMCLQLLSKRQDRRLFVKALLRL